MVEHRTYRGRVYSPGLQVYEVKVKETDLLVSTDTNLYDITLNIIYKYRTYLEKYITSQQSFLSSLVPIPPDKFAPQIIQDMIFYSEKVGVGPMAAIAGAISHYVGMELCQYSKNVIIENGGDDYVLSEKDVLVSIHAGQSPLSDKVNLRIKKEEMPLGICTSSATVGHSLSFGRADAVCVISKSPILADAAATAIGNRVKNKSSVNGALNWGIKIEGVDAILIIIDDKMGLVGNVELV